MSPTQRSLARLRKENWLCAVTEHWNPWTKRRADLFGFIDIVCLRGDETLAVQTTSGSNVAARLGKIKATQAASVWLESPNRKITIHGWDKKGPRGKRKTWECREVFVTPEMLSSCNDVETLAAKNEGRVAVKKVLSVGAMRPVGDSAAK